MAVLIDLAHARKACRLFQIMLERYGIRYFLEGGAEKSFKIDAAKLDESKRRYCQITPARTLADVVKDADVFLGHRRLSIIDLATTAFQPMANEDGRVWVVFNGEIYNHAALRAQLVAKGHRFATDHSDTEVLVHGYEEWGEGLVERLRGMFAFVVVDLETTGGAPADGSTRAHAPPARLRSPPPRPR